MTIRFIGPLLCGGLLALVATTEASAFWYIPGTDTVRVQKNPNDSRNGNKAIQQPLVGVNKKASRSSAGNRMGGGGGGKGAMRRDTEPPRGGGAGLVQKGRR